MKVEEMLKCDDILKEIPSANISLPTDKKNFTIAQLMSFLGKLSNAIETYKTLTPKPIRQKLAQGIAECIEMLVNSFIK